MIHQVNYTPPGGVGGCPSHLAEIREILAEIRVSCFLSKEPPEAENFKEIVNKSSDFLNRN